MNVGLIVGGFIIFSLLILFIIFFIFLYQRRYYEHQQEKEKLQNIFNQQILKTQLEIQEQTLKNISQEIHDNIGQALSLAKLNLNTMPVVNDDLLQQKLSNSKELVSKAITDLRGLSRSLDTDYVKEMGLLRAIEYELELIKKTGTINTQLTAEGAVYRLDKQKELILFRIVQETFNNIIKHAEAKSLVVNINYGSADLVLLITDDGKGVDLSPLNESNNSGFGLGIRNMYSRAKLIGADFSMSSSTGNGTTVKIILPLQSQQI